VSNSKQQIQHELALLAVVTDQLRTLDGHLIRQLPTEQAAYRHCISNARVVFDDSDIAETLRMSRSIFNRAKNGDHYRRNYTLTAVQQITLQKLCGNRAIEQWRQELQNGDLHIQRPIAQREQELEAELARLRKQRAG